MIGRMFDWFEAEGSTRPAALIRIGLVCLIWIRFADWVALFVSASWVAVLFSISFFLFTTLMLVGLWSRVSTAATALLLGLMYFGVGSLDFTHHHVYLLFAATALLALAPCGASFSVDRLRALAEAERAGRSPPPERGGLIAMRLIALQLSAVYLWGAVDKTTLAWLNGERLQQVFWWNYEGQPLFELLATQPVPMLLSVVVLVIEYLIAPGILIRRYQPLAIPTALALHAGFYILLPVKTFSGTMMLLYLAVIDPDATNRVIERLMGRTHGPAAG